MPPAAANASIGGRVQVAGASGKGIRNVRLTLTNAATGEKRERLSGTFGAYLFNDLPVGQICVLTVRAKRFTFAPDMRVISLLEELTDIDFVGAGQF